MPETANITHKRKVSCIKWMRKGADRMSAIAGIIDLRCGEEIENRMLLSMKHRGRTGEGRYRNGGMTLLHTRRSEREGEVPMTLCRGERRYVIGCDAMLLEKEQLRSALERAGEEISQGTDAELLLHAYALWGEKMLGHLTGTYAFAIIEEGSGEVFLARDPMGVKPLFFARHENGLLFASEMKTILSHPDMEAQLDAEGAAQLLLLGPGRTPGSGVFYGIRELEPGWSAAFRNGNLRLQRNWRLTDRVHTDSVEETSEKVRYLLEKSVSEQIRDCENVGTMLSGGLDSSAVSAICARESENSGARLQTFSLDYEGNAEHFSPNYFQPDADADYIECMCRFLRSQHRMTILSPQQLVDNIAAATVARDLPGMADVDSSLLAFCAQIRPHVQTVLSGECADEIFGGYPWYRDERLRNVDTFPWSQTTLQRAEFLRGWVKDAVAPLDFVAERYRATIADADILPENSPTDRRIKELVNLNFRWFMQTLIDRGDRIGAACDLDIRMPFCDREIAEYLYAVPWKMKEFGGREKGLLRHAMEGILPERVLYRKKSPYPKTYDPRYTDIVCALLRQLLLDDHAPVFAIVEPKALQRLLREELPWPWYGQLMRKPQTIVYMLQINYWMEHYSVRIR